MSKYFVICDPASTDAFLVMEGAAQEFTTEAAAISAAKGYSVDCYVVKATASVIPVEKHKVTRLP